MDLVDCDIPLLISKSSIKKAQTWQMTATVFVEHVNMNLTTSGNYCISILPSQAFQSVLEVLAVKLEEIPL